MRERRRTRTPEVTCARVREALSAGVDGEDPGQGPDTRGHLARCDDCARFAAVLPSLTRRTRISAATRVPDLTPGVLAALSAPPTPERPDGRLRGLVALAGVAQLLLGIAALLGAAGPDLHAGRELGALQLAIGVGLLVAARQPSRAAGVLPVVGVVAAATVMTAVVDVAAGTVSPMVELAHLGELVGVGALWALRRRPGARAPVAA